MKRYAGKLLFIIGKNSAKADSWTCECRIVLAYSESGSDAYEVLTKYGEAAQWISDDDDSVFEQCGRFVGLMELILLDNVLEGENEVWYDVFDEANVSSLVPEKHQLNAVKIEAGVSS